MRTLRTSWLSAPLALLALAPSAQAGTPFVAVSEGGADQGDIAVDASGNGHLVWVSNQPTGGVTEERLRYCVIPPDAARCAAASVRTLFPLAEGTTALVDAPDVFVDGSGTVVVVAGISQPGAAGTRAFRSNSDPPFAPTIIGPDLHAAALGPTAADGSAAISLLSDNTKEYFLGRLSGDPVGSATVTLPGQFGTAPIGEGTRVAAFGGTRALVVRDGIGSGGTSEFVTSNGGDPNVAANWNSPKPLTPSGRNSIVASGPRGLVVVSEITTAAGSQFQARRFDGDAAFSSPAVAVETGTGGVFGDLYADQASGIFHFTYEDGKRDLRWAASLDGVAWRNVIVVRNAEKTENDPAAVAGHSTGGLVVWDGTNRITAARLTAAGTDGGGGGGDDDGTGEDGDGTGGRNGGRTRCRPPNCAPVEGGNPSETVGNDQHTVDVEIPSCTVSTVKARVSLKRKTVKRRRGKKVVTRVRKVVFRLAKQRRVDKRPPYRKTFPLRHSRAGATYKLKATVKLRVKRGKRPARTTTLRLSRRFRVCTG